MRCTMRIGTAMAIVAALALTGAPPIGAVRDRAHAQAATAGATRAKGHWYWTEERAEARLKAYYSDVKTARCLGYGVTWIRRHGQRYFRGLYCYGRLTGGKGRYQILLEVQGRNKFKIVPY